MIPHDFRRIALSLPDAEASSHMGAADFRVPNRVFATLAIEAHLSGALRTSYNIRVEKNRRTRKPSRRKPSRCSSARSSSSRS